MTEHPLTDEVMYEIQGFCSGYSDPSNEDVMRAAYDKGSADRLEQVNKFFDDYCLTVDDLPQLVKLHRLLSLLNAAMSPQQQQQEDNND